MFTQKHYVAIAEVMSKRLAAARHSENWTLEAQTAIIVACQDLCNMFAADNSKFKPDMFMKACGV